MSWALSPGTEDVRRVKPNVNITASKASGAFSLRSDPFPRREHRNRFYVSCKFTPIRLPLLANVFIFMIFVKRVLVSIDTSI